MSELGLTAQQDVSINDLVDYRDQGFSVLRSAHVGNLSPYNLSLADAGIPILAVDHNITGVDTTYFPEAIMVGGNKTVVAELGLLTCRAVVDGVPLDDLHLAAAKAATEGVTIFTNTEYVRRNELISGEVLLIAARVMPELFRRVVQPDGTVRHSSSSAGLAEAGKCMQLLDDPRSEQVASLIPNEVDIILNFVIEALESERDVQFHVSGPAMVKYIGSILPTLQKLYGVLAEQASFGTRLPEVLRVELVPALDARFAVTRDKAASLDTLLEEFDQLKLEQVKMNAKRKHFFASEMSKDGELRAEFLSSIRALETANSAGFLNTLGESPIVPQLLVDAGNDSDNIGFVTQYDVVAVGGLYVAAQNRELSFRELSGITRNLRKILSNSGGQS
jgi:hypothetical protein